MPIPLWDTRDRFLLAQWGYELYREGCFDLARVIFAALCEDDPDDSYSAFALTGCLLALGEARECARIAASRLQRAPGDAALRLRHVEALAVLGQKQDARAALASLQGQMNGPLFERAQLRLSV